MMLPLACTNYPANINVVGGLKNEIVETFMWEGGYIEER